MLKNIIYITAAIVLFFAGVIVYGILLNLNEESLKDAMREKGITNLREVRLVIHRGEYKIELFSDSVCVKTYKAVFGQNRSKVKLSAEDNITPLGKYRICSVDTNSRYEKFLKLNYPNPNDASKALKEEIIDKDDFLRITSASEKGLCPPADTPLGAEIGIHGIGEYDIIFRNLPFIFNWTNGSIAVSNKNINEIYSCTGPGTEVLIKY